MSAILAAINSPTVARLKLTRNLLEKPMRDIQKKLTNILDPTHNHRAYRDSLPDATKDPCVPWLGEYFNLVLGKNFTILTCVFTQPYI